MNKKQGSGYRELAEISQGACDQGTVKNFELTPEPSLNKRGGLSG